VLAKYSDDDGHTWVPCKDASRPVPRPFYEPKLADLPWLPASATVLEQEHIFLARGGYYHDLPDRQRPGPLQVAEFTDGLWRVTTLEEEETVADAAVTASGDAVFCFYIKLATANGRATYEVRSHRWQAGRWGPSELVATETEMINHLAVPMKCPPSYAAVWWDQRVTEQSRDQLSWIRFARIPNR
jgi:hypothetical protein